MHDITRLHKRLLERSPPSALLSVLAYSPDDGLYYHDDASLGFAFRCHPMLGVDEGRVQQLQVLVAQDFPPGTMMQVSLWTSPDVEQALFVMQGLREVAVGRHESTAQRTARELVRRRSDFLRAHTGQPVSERTGTRVRDIHVIVSVKIPLRSRLPAERETEAAKRLRRASEQTLATLGMGPVALDPEKLLRTLGPMVNWAEDASWRSAALLYEEERLVRDQIFDMESAITVDDRGLWLGGKRVKTLSVKRMPEYVHLAQAAQFLGDGRTGQRGVRENLLITLNLPRVFGGCTEKLW